MHNKHIHLYKITHRYTHVLQVVQGCLVHFSIPFITSIRCWLKFQVQAKQTTYNPHMYSDRPDIGLYQTSQLPAIPFKGPFWMQWLYLEAFPCIKVQTDVCIFLIMIGGRRAERGNLIHQH